MSRLKVVHPYWAVLNIHHYSMALMPYIKGEWRSFTLAEVCLQGQKSGLFIEGSASVCFSQLDNSRLTMERLHVWRFFFACAKKEEILNIQQPLHCYLLPCLHHGWLKGPCLTEGWWYSLTNATKSSYRLLGEKQLYKQSQHCQISLDFSNVKHLLGGNA